MRVTDVCARIGSYIVDEYSQGGAIAIQFQLPWKNTPTPHRTRFERLTRLGFFTKLDKEHNVHIETEYRILPSGLLEKLDRGQIAETINPREFFKRTPWETLALMAIFSIDTSHPLGSRVIVSGDIEMSNYCNWIGYHGGPNENVPDHYWENDHCKTVPTLFAESILLYGTPGLEDTDLVWDGAGQSPLSSCSL